MSYRPGKKFASSKEDTSLHLSDLNQRYQKLQSGFNENLRFEVKYLLISLGVLLATFANIHKNNISNYNFKLLFVLVLYFLRRVVSKVWFHYRLSEKLVHQSYLYLFYIAVFLLVGDVIYLLVCLFLSNSFFHLMTLFMVAILQIPLLRIFPNKEKRYEGAPQELLFNGKKILFLSAELVYYNICIPMIFSQKNNVFINTKALITYSIIIFLHAVLILFSYSYYKNSADFHIYCKMMGCWKKINPPESVKLKASNWSLGVYEKSVVVKYKNSFYQGMEEKNVGEPVDYNMVMLYTIFINPKRFFLKVLGAQSILTVLTLIFVIQSYSNIFSLIIGVISWHNFYFILESNKNINSLFSDK
mmetsp:Transcript_6069/g.6295  ORF Transcript_6069/g.6295 Transcript_6069/m.6295 type:complete len:359 (+) Transcript_6069:7-1083(+)